MSIRKKIQRVPRSPRVSDGIKPVGASATQNQEYLPDGTWYPDRTEAAPLVLQPFSSYSDAISGKYVENAMPEVTNGQWYRLDDTNRSLGLCEATKISTSQSAVDSAGNTYMVFTVVSTPGDPNYGRLTIRENVPVGESVTYVFEGLLTTDGRTIRSYYTSRCDSKTELPDINFDNNPTAVYDPLEGDRYYSLNPSLSSDFPVVWKWKSYHELEGGWVDLCSTQLDWCIEKVGNGIKIDRQRMPDMIVLSIIAEITIDGTTYEQERPVTHTRRMPRFEYDIMCIGDLPEDVDYISPYAHIVSGGKEITDDSELSVTWHNSAGTQVGVGINPTIPLSALGSDGMLNLKVTDRGGHAALIDNGYLIVDGGALILVRSKA